MLVKLPPPTSAIPLASFARAKLEAGGQTSYHVRAFFLPALYLELPYLSREPFNTVLVLLLKVVDLLHRVVNLLYARAHLVQAAAIYRGRNTGFCSLPEFAGGKLVVFRR